MPGTVAASPAGTRGVKRSRKLLFTATLACRGERLQRQPLALRLFSLPIATVLRVQPPASAVLIRRWRGGTTAGTCAACARANGAAGSAGPVAGLDGAPARAHVHSTAAAAQRANYSSLRGDAARRSRCGCAGSRVSPSTQVCTRETCARGKDGAPREGQPDFTDELRSFAPSTAGP